MRTRIKVTDLTLRQWDHLQDNLQPEYDIPDGAVRVCVRFEPDNPFNYRDVEMPVRAFMALMTRLQRIERHAEIEEGTAELPPLPAKWSAPLSGPARAILTPDELPGHLESVRNAADPARATERTCDHGSPVTNETPSVFEGADPVRTYADGCSSVGPYQNSPEQVTEKLTGDRPSWTDS